MRLASLQWLASLPSVCSQTCPSNGVTIMFTIALFASFLVLGMILAAPLSTSFREADFAAFFMSLKQERADKIELERQDAVINMLRKAREACAGTTTIKGMPAIQGREKADPVVLDAGVRCHVAITYTPKV